MASDKGRQQEVILPIQTVNKADDVGNVMTPYVYVEEFLNPAIISVSILGMLVEITAAQDDFPMNKNPPKDGYKYIRSPDSFKKCIHDMVSLGWKAFTEADGKMELIPIYSTSILNEIRSIYEILDQGVETIQAKLPEKREEICNSAKESVILISDVKEKFHDLISLVKELLPACYNAKKQYEQSKKEAEQAMEQLKIKEEEAKKDMKLAEDSYKSMKKLFNDSAIQYKQAVGNIPTGSDVVALSLAMKMVNMVRNVGALVLDQFVGKPDMLLNQGQTPETGKPKEALNISQIICCALSDALLFLAVQFKVMIDGEGGLRRELETDWIKDNLVALRDKINTEEPSTQQKEAQRLCQKGIEICEKLGKIARSKDGNKAEKIIVDDILELHKEAERFDNYLKRSRDACPMFSVTPPSVAKCQKEPGSLEKPFLVAQQHREMVDATRKAHRDQFDLFREQKDKWTQVLVEMENYKRENIDFEQTLEMLTRSLTALGHVTEKLEKMSLVFETISNLIGTCSDENIQQLLSIAESAPRIAKHSAESFVVGMLYNQAHTAFVAVQLVSTIAEAYNEMSSKGLKKSVTMLNKLLHVASPSEVQRFLDGCKEAQKAMSTFLHKKRDEFDKMLQALGNAEVAPSDE